jgi:hypothetical protein
MGFLQLAAASTPQVLTFVAARPLQQQLQDGLRLQLLTDAAAAATAAA